MVCFFEVARSYTGVVWRAHGLRVVGRESLLLKTTQSASCGVWDNIVVDAVGGNGHVDPRAVENVLSPTGFSFIDGPPVGRYSQTRCEYMNMRWSYV